MFNLNNESLKKMLTFVEEFEPANGHETQAFYCMDCSNQCAENCAYNCHKKNDRK